jgi:hypothetical protein
VTRYPVDLGRPGWPTPTGPFTLRSPGQGMAPTTREGRGNPGKRGVTVRAEYYPTPSGGTQKEVLGSRWPSALRR